MAKASRKISHIEEQMSENAIFDTWTQTWGLKVYPTYGIDRLKFSFIEKGASGKGNSFNIYIECLRDGAQCFDNWAYDILHGRFERILADEKAEKLAYPNTYKYVTGENAEKSLGIMNSTKGGYCINAPVIGKDGKQVVSKDGKKMFANIPVSFHDLRHIAERYFVSYHDRKNELEQIRKIASESWHGDGEPEETNSPTAALDEAASETTPADAHVQDTDKKKAPKKPTPKTIMRELKTLDVLSEDGKGNYLLSAIDRENNTAEYVFPREYWESDKYGKIGEQFKKKASSEDGIMVTLHFYVYKNKKYVAKIGK